MRKKKFKSKLKKKLSVFMTLLTVVFQLFYSIPTVQAEPVDITSNFPFITGVALTDGKGNPINESSNPISKNAEVKLTYEFTIPNQGTVKKGDIYTMEIPEEIQIVSTLNFPVTIDNGDTIANVKIGTDGNVNITFTEFAENNSNVSGFFYIDTQFDPDKIGMGNPISIKFEVGGSSSPVIINLNFEQPEIPKASIDKEGSYNPSKNEITWKVTINPEAVKVNNAQIVDNIPAGQEFIPGSVEINGSNADTTNYIYDVSNKRITYNFPSLIEAHQIITFKTKVTDPKAFESEGAAVYEYNKATFNYDGTSVNSNEASVEVVADFIRKDGKYDAATKRINWTIYTNNNAQSIPNAVVTDDIPSGLTFTPGSVKIDGNPTNDDYSLNGQGFTYTFPTAINEPHKIEFSTDITDEDAFNSNNGKTYNNKVTITGTGVPGNASDNKSVEVPTNVINKQGVGYNMATGEITWEVTINSNKIPIKNPVVTDDIRLGQEYVADSATIDKAIPGGTFDYVKVENDQNKTGILTYTFSGDINETYIITFKTKVTDPNVYAGNRDEYYYNVAKLTGANINPSTSQGTQLVRSQVIYKASQDYNYVTREITWNVLVNRNGMTLPNAYITDVIEEGQEFVLNSVNLNGNPADTSNYVYDATTKTLRYNFPSEINSWQQITFKTKITDDSIFNTNGEKELKNTAKITTDLVPGGIESAGTAKIKSTLMDKKADYTKGNSYIDWNVTINSNKILIKDAVLTDTLQEGLDLDTTSVKLYKQTLNPDGSLVKGDEVTLDRNSVKYNTATREFIFTMPALTDDAYILTFRTDVVDKTKSPFTNSISFKGTGIIQSSSSGKVDVIFQGAGGGGVGETGSIKVMKVDKNNENIKLEGAIFELLDKYQNVIRTSEPTEANGESIFNKLKFNIDYYVREKLAPTGYILSNELYKFQLKNTQDEKNITYNYKNEKITGEIEFFKNGESSNPLKGAKFTLYKLSDIAYANPLATALSDENGKVQFENVEYGEYVIKETKAPEGYNLSDEILKAAITEDGKVVKANPESISNTKIRGNIEFTKIDEDKQPLQGAEFKLYKETDTKFENPIATAVSDENGKVQFENVEYGKYTIKETKAPEGYVLSEEVLTANVTENDSTVKANPESISNTKIRASVQVKKLDQDKKPLKGAEFTLYYADGKEVETSVSGEDGTALFKDLLYGEYMIKETKVPEGYLASEGTIKVFVDKDGTLYTYEVVNNRIKGSIVIIKTDMNGKLLQGAEFTLYDKDGKEVTTAVSGKDGVVTFNDVDYGNYTIKETEAPKGYILSEEKLEVNVNSVESQTFTVKNKEEKLIDKIVDVLPKTGGVFNYKIIIGALTIIGGISLLLKKNKSK
ncbi:SpaA isopeptide-forming pilin-related protein [Clostridium sp.]|uniref:SpaA isopeptide-forming pilin-related protein n=1 Tax=Clostridium sp. TaxID=1506 RepID=UPI003216646D